MIASTYIHCSRRFRAMASLFGLAVAAMTAQTPPGQPPLLITSSSRLADGAEGTNYQERILAAGGTPPYVWSIGSGSVPGLSLDSSTGVLSGTARAAGTFPFEVTVRDSANGTATQAFSLTIAPGPLRLLPLAPLQYTLGNPFSLSLTAAGGTAPYTWSATGVPEGLEINAASGVVSGVFRTVGPFRFLITVSDAKGATAAGSISVEVLAPPLPGLKTMDVPDNAEAAAQLGILLRLSSPYSLPLSGQLVLAFSSETGSEDAALQFSSGGRIVDFQIPAGKMEAQFATPSLGLQTGTVAGTITLSARLQTGGVTLTPEPIPIQSIRIDPGRPVITSATFSRSGTAIAVRITGYSTSREVTQGVFQFRATGANTLTNQEVKLPLESMFGTWFRDPASAPYGGQFSFTQQFNVQGDVNAVAPVSVTLTNSLGSGTAAIRE